MTKGAGAKKNGRLWPVLNCLGILAFCFGMQILLLLTNDNALHSIRLGDTAAPVEATITHVEMQEDNDDYSDEDYRLYVSYVYKGIPYHKVSYGVEEHMAQDGFIGRRVVLHVDPQNPRIICDTSENAGATFVFMIIFSTVISGMMIAMVARMFSNWCVSAEWQRIYEGDTLTRLQIQADLDGEMSFSWKYTWYGVIVMLGFILAMLLALMSRLNWGVYVKILLAGYAISVALRVLYLIRAAKNRDVKEIRFVRREEVIKDSEGDVACWKLEGYGRWYPNDDSFVAITGLPWSREYPLENYWIALNRKGKILRIFSGDAFSTASCD